jgi:dienelactone hydrolase
MRVFGLALALVAAQAAPDLLSARKGFETKPVPSSYKADGPADVPPAALLKVIRYRAPSGDLVAYLTPDPKDGKKRPAVLWAHGGFGGIGAFLYGRPDPANDQTGRAFREAGCVMMYPSWRGENDNPGRYEMFFGEVDDLLAARDHLAALPYVDPDRVYLAGHSTGGTLVLLAACATDKFRAAFSFGGAPDVARIVSDGKGYGNTPFDFRSAEEGRLRSAANFAAAIKRPTFYFEGEKSAYNEDAARMEKAAAKAGAPFKAFMVKGGDHFTILDPLTRLVAAKVVADVGPAPVAVTPLEIAKACPPPGPIDLLKLLDLKQDVVQGEWGFKEGKLHSGKGQGTRIQIPYLPPDEYDLTIVAARVEGTDSMNIGLVRGSSQFCACVDGWTSTVHGLSLVDGKLAADNETARRIGGVLKQNRPSTIVCSVRTESVTVTVDGRKVIEWKGDASRLSNYKEIAVPNPRALFMATWDTRFLFAKMTLTPISGEGQKLR